MGRWLVLGGTRFLSRTVAATALARGHDVVCVARGESGDIPDGAKLVVADRDVPGSLDVLRGERFDAVVDVARMSYAWVRDALDALAGDAAHWSFVSTISVYADSATHGSDSSAELLAPLEAIDDDHPADAPDTYGALKVAGENAVRATFGDAGLVVRAGLICGPGDLSDRFGYWPARFVTGGRAVVPDTPGHPAQIVDVRDLATFIVEGGERRIGGTFDGSGPRTTLGALLDEVADAVGAPDLDRVALSPDALVAAGVEPWSGPRSLPLWLSAADQGMVARDTSAVAAAGLRARSIGDTARAALEHERKLGINRERRAGLNPSDERTILASVAG
ncbi:NAD-dependent epimerase/dehydratase family protein [Pseudonocardia sp. TRM90224]|uniref:NAD-dependent epimerase/dehydratase family protein n=1 Tax=Pseudonocardia sp. TRM90224 TaxID=2812678 RepID=UPI001E54B43B|nr:NAD-dependent epimerase/dehydratase family protein [Pseudonocardia sp. TRM90224]